MLLRDETGVEKRAEPSPQREEEPKAQLNTYWTNQLT
jgi:hypothetical protein